MITKHIYSYRDIDQGGVIPVATLAVDTTDPNNPKFGVSIYNFDKDMGHPENGFSFFNKKEGRRIAEERCKSGDNTIPECNRYIDVLCDDWAGDRWYDYIDQVKLKDEIVAELASFGFEFE